MRRLSYLLLPLLACPAFAQDYSGTQSRLDRIERDLTFIQRQVYQGGDPNAIPGATSGGANSGALQTQLMQIQEEMRRLRGQVEQAEYRASQAESNLKRLQEDVDFRLQRLEQQAAAAAAVPAPAPATDIPPAATEPAPAPAPASRSEGFNVNEGSGSARYEPEAKAAAPASGSFSSPRDHYNHAYKLLNEAKYADAASSFAQFTKQYPDDALVPNAYYWMGESYYARRDFTQAAEGFRKGYEANPKSQKAADNLLKLSLSLANLKRQDEACIVLKQVSAQYAAQKATASKAENEYKRLGCA